MLMSLEISVALLSDCSQMILATWVMLTTCNLFHYPATTWSVSVSHVYGTNRPYLLGGHVSHAVCDLESETVEV